MDQAIRFIRKNGRIIPIRALGHGAGAASVAQRTVKFGKSAAHVISHSKQKPGQEHVDVDRRMNALGIGLSVASGALGAATFAGGAKTFLGGALATHALDAVGISANIASVAKGKASTEAKAKQAAKQEARNFVIGNGLYLAGIVGLKRNRQAAIGYAKDGLQTAKAGLQHAKKLLEFSRKALGALGE